MAVIYQRNFVPRLFRKLVLWGEQPQYAPISEGVQLTLDASQFFDGAEEPGYDDAVKAAISNNWSSYRPLPGAGWIDINPPTQPPDIAVGTCKLYNHSDDPTKRFSNVQRRQAAFQDVLKAPTSSAPVSGGIGFGYPDQEDGMYQIAWNMFFRAEMNSDPRFAALVIGQFNTYGAIVTFNQDTLVILDTDDLLVMTNYRNELTFKGSIVAPLRAGNYVIAIIHNNNNDVNVKGGIFTIQMERIYNVSVFPPI